MGGVASTEDQGGTGELEDEGGNGGLEDQESRQACEDKGASSKYELVEGGGKAKGLVSPWQPM